MELPASGQLAAGPSEERKLATILFADLVGSTALASDEDPERTRLLLERFYDAMAAEIDAAGGTADKFIGDAVMAAFGVPIAREDHAERALHAALAMQQRMRELFGDSLHLRIGVNTGEVVIGRARADSSFVSGDAVNVAARLEQAADPGHVLVGERTVAAAQGAFEFGEPATVEAKGKPAGVRCRMLVRALGRQRPRGRPGLGRAFVGRDEELEQLEGAYLRVVETGSPHLVTIVGEAGVGKSRLVAQLREWLGEQSPAPLLRTGHCLPYGRAITYWPVAEMIREHFGIDESETAEAVTERLGDRAILALTLGQEATTEELHPLVARDRLHEALADLLAELVAERPVLLSIEDLHWAEGELLDLFDRLLRSISGPLLILASARPELFDVRPGWGGARRAATTLELEPLSQDASQRLLEELLSTSLPDELRELVTDHAEGNPFFVEEVLGMLIDRGALAFEQGAWKLRAPAVEVSVPDSVRAVLAARIDLLEPAEKAALQLAAVIGRTFWLGPIHTLLDDATPDVHVLEERDFVSRRARSSILDETEFAFKHQLTREVAYNSLPKARRAQLHAGFAGWLEEAGGGRDEHAPLLADHYARAVRPEDADLAWPGAEAELRATQERAVVWLRRAADLAVRRYEIGGAVELLEQALPLAADNVTRVEILRQIADAHLNNFDVERFRAALEEALALGAERSVTAQIYAELAFYAHGRPYMWKGAPPDDVRDRWLAQALELGEPGTAARARALLAGALANPVVSQAAIEEAGAIAGELANPRLLVHAYEAQTHAATVTRRFEDACTTVERELEAVEHVSDPGLQLYSHWHAAFVYLRGGRLTEVPRLLAACDRLAAGLSTHDRVHAVAVDTLYRASSGRWDELAELAPAAEDAAEQNEGTPCQFNWRAPLVCALGFAHLGDEREARRLEELARESAVVGGPAERDPALLRLALLRGELEQVARILEHLRTGTRTEHWDVDADAARLDALAALGDADRVEEIAEPFLGGVSYTRPFALRALGFVRGDRGLLEQAAARFEELGLTWHAQMTRELGSSRDARLLG